MAQPCESKCEVLVLNIRQKKIIQSTQLIHAAFWLKMLRCEEIKEFILKMAKYLQLDIRGHLTRSTLLSFLFLSHSTISRLLSTFYSFSQHDYEPLPFCTNTKLFFSDLIRHIICVLYTIFVRANMLKSDRKIKKKEARKTEAIFFLCYFIN